MLGKVAQSQPPSALHTATQQQAGPSQATQAVMAAPTQALFNDVKGDECIYLWRAIGAALISVVSVTSYSLRVSF